MNLEELIQIIEEVKRQLAFDRRVSRNSTLTKRLDKDELTVLKRKNLESRFRNRGNPEIIKRIIESEILQ
jgi:hypothetical protein